jgi:hypothetical protein
MPHQAKKQINSFLFKEIHLKNEPICFPLQHGGKKSGMPWYGLFTPSSLLHASPWFPHFE